MVSKHPEIYFIYDHESYFLAFWGYSRWLISFYPLFHGVLDEAWWQRVTGVLVYFFGKLFQNGRVPD